jgi:hypothetical protein
MKQPFPIMFVWWQDAYVSTEDKPQLEGDRLTISFGVKADEDKEFIHLSHFFCGINQAFTDPFTSIPKGMIKKIQVIGKQVGRPKKKKVIRKKPQRKKR